MTIKRYSVARYGSGNIVHAPVIRAGNWVFCTGLRAVAADGAIDAGVLKAGRPLDTPPKAEREAQFIFSKMDEQLRAAGSVLSLVARLDQYYPDWRSVDAYHCARKAALRGQVAPSTSVLVDGLLNVDAAMDIQVMAATLDSGLEVGPVATPKVGAPAESGYSPCLRAGDLIFVAGQLARDQSGNIAPEAMVPATQLWKGTRIKLETDYLVHQRLVPALQASQSGPDLILKAQVYLSREEDLPAFWQAWAAAFDGVVPPTTIVPVSHPAFGTRDATIEVNVIAAHESARGRIRDIECDVELICPDMMPARRLDDLLFVAGLMAIDRNGLVAQAGVNASAPYFDDSSGAQARDILQKAARIFQAGGTDLGNVVRALHFQRRLDNIPAIYAPWRDVLGDAGLPFSAVQVAPSLFVPGAELILDLIGYVPSAS
ncbi:RidA family protein [Bordetella sp. BOR01]|uniref:RidA family protein n=1 Tax=Bordetella sp. BOR01 TaxID=2854779 RepID=UPI001C4773E7|nr:RidA family protein [Bordetella sp. BOR01]MBV7484268.1 RidA family protein [Bordetella sp. BOR01]